MRRKVVIFTLLVLAAMLQAAYHYRQLSAAPNGSEAQGVSGLPAAWLLVAVGPALAIYLGLQFLVLSSLFRHLPEWVLGAIEWLRRHQALHAWQQPRQRQQAGAFLAGQMAWLGVGTIVFLLCAIERAVQANLGAHPGLCERAGWALLAAYGVFVVAWAARFWLRLRDSAETEA